MWNTDIPVLLTTGTVEHRYTCIVDKRHGGTQIHLYCCQRHGGTHTPVLLTVDKVKHRHYFFLVVLIADTLEYR